MPGRPGGAPEVSRRSMVELGPLFLRAPNHLGDGVMALPRSPRWPQRFSRADRLPPVGRRPLPGPAGERVAARPRPIRRDRDPLPAVLPVRVLARRAGRRVGLATDGRGPAHGPRGAPARHRRDEYTALAEVLGVQGHGPPQFQATGTELAVFAGLRIHVGLNPLSRSGPPVEWPFFAELAAGSREPLRVYARPRGGGAARARVPGVEDLAGLSLGRLAARSPGAGRSSPTIPGWPTSPRRAAYRGGDPRSTTAARTGPWARRPSRARPAVPPLLPEAVSVPACRASRDPSGAGPGGDSVIGGPTVAVRFSSLGDVVLAGAVTGRSRRSRSSPSPGTPRWPRSCRAWSGWRRPAGEGSPRSRPACPRRAPRGPPRVAPDPCARAPGGWEVATARSGHPAPSPARRAERPRPARGGGPLRGGHGGARRVPCPGSPRRPPGRAPRGARSSWAAKRWPGARFAAVARAGTAGDRPRGARRGGAVRGRGRRCGRRAEVAAGPGFAGALAALGRGRAALANDAGLAHLCAAAGIPTVVVFGATTPADGFWDGRCTPVEVDLECRPCTR